MRGKWKVRSKCTEGNVEAGAAAICRRGRASRQLKGPQTLSFQSECLINSDEFEKELLTSENANW